MPSKLAEYGVRLPISINRPWSYLASFRRHDDLKAENRYFLYSFIPFNALARDKPFRILDEPCLAKTRVLVPGARVVSTQYLHITDRRIDISTMYYGALHSRLMRLCCWAVKTILCQFDAVSQCYSSSQNHFNFSFYKVWAQYLQYRNLYSIWILFSSSFYTVFRNHLSSVSVGLSVFTSFQLQFFIDCCWTQSSAY